VRVYLPSTLPALRAALAAGGFGPPPVLAFAVTPALREWYTAGDLEELEYAATTDASRASLRQLEADPAAPSRRVVVAADVPDLDIVLAPELERAAVQVAVAVPFGKVVAVLVDSAEAEADVRAAAAVVAKADLGDEDAGFVVDGVEDHELEWYAAQEIPDLFR
jgi:hypothetical protein